MKRRAELERQTRQRIIESAAALHTELLGPARTTMSAIAEHAGVPRSTVYRHFPDEETLFAACSSHWAAANPPPDPGAWSAIADPATRTETALRELYAYYGATQRAYENLLRDEELVPVVKRLMTGYHDYLRSVQDVLMAGRGLRGRALHRTRATIGLALAFASWRSLTQEQGLDEGEAVAVTSLLVQGSAGAGSAR
ncbi:MAG TPA: TetR/AcrR family transcriptional regulator [Thermoleophilaceae bacterium]|jgi:AcrR family transcriptional regulator|nr:TetR/AcrR family transcriptional regulator [Thermoleophilaceae bacterium]